MSENTANGLLALGILFLSCLGFCGLMSVRA